FRYSCTSSRPTPHPHSFPTRRSSDLGVESMGSPSFQTCSPAPTVTCRSRRPATCSPRMKLMRLSAVKGAAPARKYGARVAELARSEEHTSELQSRFDLVCRLLLEKKK